MTPDDRRRLIAKAPQTKLELKHTRRAKILPDRFALLDVLPKRGIVAEIGAAQGDFTTEIIKRNQPSKLHLVDAWSLERYQSGIDAIEEKLAPEIAAGRVVLNRGLSTERLPEFPDSYFDWVYIDTDHSYDLTLQELRICEPKMKRGGIIAGHDYCVGNIVAPWPYGVIQACHQFCSENGWCYTYLTLESHGHFSFALARI